MLKYFRLFVDKPAGPTHHADMTWTSKCLCRDNTTQLKLQIGYPMREPKRTSCMSIPWPERDIEKKLAKFDEANGIT